MSTKAQQSLAQAFNELVLERRFEDIHIADIIKRADVSRSTFYEHYRNKEQILVHSLRVVLRPIAEATVAAKDCNSLTPILEHFVEVKELALAYFHSPLSRVMVELLTELTFNEMQANQFENKLRLPREILCSQIAHSNLGFIEAWLNDVSKLSSIEVEAQLIKGTQALIAAANQ
ncbi:MAG: TetR/AcrR family transcriptional regulator [Planctomycetota bacterium]